MFTNISFNKQKYVPLLPDPPKKQQLDKPEPSGSAMAPGSKIPYRPDMIQRFQEQHAELQKTFSGIMSRARSNDFAYTRKSLHVFKQDLTSHLLEENIKLYTYLSRCLANDPDNKERMQNMRSEMEHIGTAMMRIINKYVAMEIPPSDKQAFLDDLDEVGTMLFNRIEQEESSLYAMYVPPEDFQ